MAINLKEILKQPEGKTLEFKRDLSSPKKILITLTAFANTAGGIIIIGVEDKTHAVIGIDSPLDEEERLCNIIADGIEPRLVPDIELITLEDKTLLVVQVFPGALRPYWIKSEGYAEGVYVRIGSTNRKADSDLIEELRRSAAGAVFDEQPLPEISPDSIDIDAASRFFEGIRGITAKDLESLKILTREQGKSVPTIGGVLLFGKNRDQLFPDAWIQCGRFTGTDKTNIFDHSDIHGHLPGIVEGALDFLKKHAIRSADITGVHRKDVWNIPLIILREAVINAVVHADYSQKGAPLRVSFFDDRIEIENPGILLPGLTIEDIKQGISRLRNRVIGRVFKELGLIEQWGSGIRRMFNEAEKLGLPEPVIEEIGMRYRCTVYFTGILNSEKLSARKGTKLALSRHHVKILRKCEKECSIADLMELMDRTDRTKFRNSVLKPLLDAGLIEMTIPDKPKSSRQKYRLTNIGRNEMDRDK